MQGRGGLSKRQVVVVALRTDNRARPTAIKRHDDEEDRNVLAGTVAVFMWGLLWGVWTGSMCFSEKDMGGMMMMTAASAGGSRHKHSAARKLSKGQASRGSACRP